MRSGQAFDPPSRILVLGCPGAGKTTVAGELAEVTGLPVRHLDDEYWGSGWSRPAEQQWVAHQRQLTSEPCWIIDGNYLSTIGLRAGRAELVVLMETSTIRCLTRVALRAIRIRRGWHQGLPARVRAQADAGHRPPATKDFAELLKMILRFRSESWWAVIDRARINPSASLIVAVGPRPSGRRLDRVRGRLRTRGVSARVVAVSELSAVVAGTAGRRRTAQKGRS